MILENQEYTLCLFCEAICKVNSKTDEINMVLKNVQKEIRKLKEVERQNINYSSGEAFEKKSDVMCRVQELEEKIMGVQGKVNGSECFKIDRKVVQIKGCAKHSDVVTSNAFQVLEKRCER